MTGKEIVGIAVDGPYLRIARLEAKKHVLRILDLQTVGLTEPVDLVTLEDPVPFPVEAESGREEAPFGIMEEATEPSGNGNANGSVAVDIDIFRMADEFQKQADPEEETTAEKLAQILESFSRSRVDVALSLPLGFTILHPMSRRDYHSLKKKQISESVKEEIRSVYEPMESDVRYAYDIQDSGAMLLASCDGENHLLNVFDDANSLYSNKTFIREIMPDEAAMIGLVRANYPLPGTQITALVITGEDSSRILFLQGKDVIEILPLLHTGKKDPRTIQTIFSKIILHLDQGNIPILDLILFTNTSISRNSAPDLLDHFPDVRIENMELNPERIQYAPDERIQMHKYMQAIAIGWAASGEDKKEIPSLSLIPDYVHERQKVFKLEWHGILLLSLITLAPIVLNHYYQQNRQTISDLQDNITMVEQQIELSRPVANQVEKLAGEYAYLDDQMTFLDSLGRNAYRWSITLKRLSDGIDQLKNLWISNMTVAGDKLVVEGYSLYRNRIPRLAGLFAHVNIKEMVEVEQRDITLYKFIMSIDRIDQSPGTLNP